MSVHIDLGADPLAFFRVDRGGHMLTVSAQPAAGAERRFFAWMALASVAVVFAGFATSYYLWPLTRATHYPAGQPISQSLPLVVHIHALAFSGWVGLLGVQAALVSQGRVAAHRRVGGLAGGLLPIMVATGLMTAVR